MGPFFLPVPSSERDEVKVVHTLDQSGIGDHPHCSSVSLNASVGIRPFCERNVAHVATEMMKVSRGRDFVCEERGKIIINFSA